MILPNLAIILYLNHTTTVVPKNVPSTCPTPHFNLGTNREMSLGLSKTFRKYLKNECLAVEKSKLSHWALAISELRLAVNCVSGITISVPEWGYQPLYRGILWERCIE